MNTVFAWIGGILVLVALTTGATYDPPNDGWTPLDPPPFGWTEPVPPEPPTLGS